MQTKNATRPYPRRAQRISGGDGTDFVRCRICGKHLRVISGRHLSCFEFSNDKRQFQVGYVVTCVIARNNTLWAAWLTGC